MSISPRRAAVSAATLLAVLTLGLRLWVGPRTVDDAFITLRYANNIVRGAGFVYNAGERILGTTTPLFALLLALSRLVTGNLELVALIFNTIADAATVIMLYIMTLRLSGRTVTALACGLLFAFSAGSIRFAVGGMETSVFTFLCVLSCWLFLSERYRATGIATGLAILVRPEALILLAALVVVFFLTHRRVPWVLLAGGVGVPLPWIVFALGYFGSPIPHSVLAKSVYDFPRLFAAKSLLGYLVRYTLPMGEASVVGLPKYALLGVYLVLGSIAAYRTGRLAPKSLVLYAFPVAYLAAYSLANPPVWEWYAIPVVPFVSFGLCVGASGVAQAAKTRFAALRVVRIWQAAIVALLILAGAAQVRQILRSDPRQGRELAYVNIAGKLDAMVDVGTTIATPEIGVLGYFLPEAEILDTQGLVSPRAVPYHQAMMESLQGSDYERVWEVGSSIPVDLIQAERPDFVVSLEVFARPLLNDGWFMNNYTLIEKEPSTVFGSDGVLAFQRVRAQSNP